MAAWWIDRRTFFGAVGASAAGCVSQMQMNPGLPPWHMWGVSEIVDVSTPGTVAPIQQVSAQLARVQYKRPETWAFLFWSRVVSAVPPAPAANQLNITVDFYVTAGTGRSVFAPSIMPVNETGTALSFVQFRYQRGAGPPLAGHRTFKWATEGRTPVYDELAPTPFQGTVRTIVADNINCVAAVNISCLDPFVLKVEVGASFAPVSHVRPDWFRDAPEPAAFLGNECGGS